MKSKESRRVMVGQHDEAINRLERAKEVCCCYDNQISVCTVRCALLRPVVHVRPP